MAQSNQTIGDATGAGGANASLYRTANQTNTYNDPKSFLKFIPNFDGTKEGCTPRALIKCCERARTLIPQMNEENIVFALMSKFKGEYAARIIEEDIRTIDNLIKFIRSNFENPSVSYTDRIVEFQSVRQAQYERVSAYGERVTKILREVIDDITQSDMDGKEETERIITAIAVKGFIKGLRPQYVRLLKNVKFERLALAIEEATGAEALCTEYPNLGIIENNTASCFNVQREQKQNTQTAHTNNKHCNYCNRVGHEWIERRVKKREDELKYGNTQNTGNINKYNNQNNMNTNNKNNIPNNNNQNYRNNRSNNNQYPDNNRRNNSNYQNNRFNANRNQRQNNQNNSSNQYNIQCNYCQKFGHIATECRKRMYEERQRQNNFPVTENNRSAEAQAGNEQGAPRNGAPTGNPQ
ncbi:hypothetical protein PV328_011762 [Microctonus aethiopoides]|uniref:CCHC-type domain-containing protein n=1 Tax=Microctonus aethiopoides TaxID=144406 RepID=A0AA39C3I7_9HYME|nr:hypothetical protein PV328_011762 [Microctonus aethiopoides]